MKGNTCFCRNGNGISILPRTLSAGSKLAWSVLYVLSLICLTPGFSFCPPSDICFFNPRDRKDSRENSQGTYAALSLAAQSYHSDEIICFSVPEHKKYFMHLSISLDQHNNQNSVNTKAYVKIKQKPVSLPLYYNPNRL